ncbi:helix-turn-helix domain-containing protein [Streptomyces sp. WMMC500]|uniref:AraC family transcriptional regulator n=1 Tax=Streptomyces sp. WMMC500 TaxID=3015154 RepID=UPI00248C7473|nr:helix-turn-helix domain-containing protein [Streptomyces sp. WMMC500]WBB63933.1 helix-turn-helix domain-containing protein [Streptomyces sp. WMMC500]
MPGSGFDDVRGVLHPGEHARLAALDRRAPGPAVAPFVDGYWHVRWHLPDADTYDTKVLTHPNLHLVFEEPEPLVYGVQRDLFVRRLTGAGQVLGVRFRPGGFRPLARGPVAELADRRVPAAELFGPGVAEVSRAVLRAGAVAEMCALAEDFLRPLLPAAPEPAAEEAAAVVARIAAEPGLLRVTEVAAAAGMSVRRLQRLFAEYVGASPKWVLRRARLQEAAARADAGTPPDLAALAADLGYADQAHLTRDFTATVGAPPTRYAEGTPD